MTTTQLQTPYEVTPAVPAVTAASFTLCDVQENYGYSKDSFQGRGRPNSVEVTVTFNTVPETYQRVTAWSDDSYLAVRGVWTDATLAARVAEILSGAA